MRLHQIDTALAALHHARADRVGDGFWTGACVIDVVDYSRLQAPLASMKKKPAGIVRRA
jgi:hypothetical protein